MSLKESLKKWFDDEGLSQKVIDGMAASRIRHVYGDERQPESLKPLAPPEKLSLRVRFQNWLKETRIEFQKNRSSEGLSPKEVEKEIERRIRQERF